jgi:hypothetical protein
MPIRIRDDLVEAFAMAICAAIEAGGLSVHEQLVCLQSVEAVALAQLPPAERAHARRAHEAALDLLADDNRLVPQ